MAGVTQPPPDHSEKDETDCPWGQAEGCADFLVALPCESLEDNGVLSRPKTGLKATKDFARVQHVIGASEVERLPGVMCRVRAIRDPLTSREPQHGRLANLAAHDPWNGATEPRLDYWCCRRHPPRATNRLQKGDPDLLSKVFGFFASDT